MSYPQIELCKKIFFNHFENDMQCQGNVGELLFEQNDIVHIWEQLNTENLLTFKSLTNENFFITISSTGKIKGKSFLFLPDYYIFTYHENLNFLHLRDLNNPKFNLEIIFFKKEKI